MGGTMIYWDGILISLAAAVTVLLYTGFYLNKSGNGLAAAVSIPLTIAISLLLGRLFHWYCLTNSYESFAAAFMDYSSGGYSLAGVVIACILAAGLLRMLRISDNLPDMLDCMCLSGCAGIAIGRLASFFNASDRGPILASVTELPWVYPVTNGVSGAIEYRLATFLIQAMAAGVLFLILFGLYLWNDPRKKSGMITLFFALVYGASQVILDSTRYDSLYFRSNGFVSVVQVLGAVALVAAVVIFAVQMVKVCGFQKWYIAVWLLILAMIGGAGYMEYHVQRHANQAPMAYSVMSACLTGVIFLSVWMCVRRIRKEK